MSELSDTINDVEFLKQQNEINLALANKLSEEIAALQKKEKALKRARIASLCCVGSGLVLIGASKIPGVDEKWQQGLFIGGIGLTASGGITLGLSFSIPF